MYKRQVPAFDRIAEAYGIRAVKLSSYDELDKYASWVADNEPCLFDIPLPENSLLTPKIKFETQVIRPELDNAVVSSVKRILGR